MFTGNAFWRIWNYISSMRISDVVDILLVAYLVYQVITLLSKTKAWNITKGVVLFVLVVGLSDALNLTMTNYILRKAIEIGLLAIVILFQPELRRLLEKIGSRFSTKNRNLTVYDMETAIKQTTIACEEMSKSKTGALIIFEREYKLNEILETGTKIDSEVSAELLKNIFYNKAPLHDGAVIIRNGRIAGAGCVLPLTKSKNLSKDLGMRHRAGIGLSEESDAVVVIVSEETGAISCANDGLLKRHLNSKNLDMLLRSKLLTEDNQENDGKIITLIKKLFVANDDEDMINEKTDGQ